MADKNAEVAVEDNGGMKKTLSLWNFFTIGFGAIIGTGWVLQVGDTPLPFFRFAVSLYGAAGRKSG